MNHENPARLAGMLAAGALACAAQAQDTTRIVAATLYPDSASVERELKVPGGTRHVVLACVPGAVDVSTLQVDGDPELRLGEIRTTKLPQKRWAECATDAGEQRASELELKLSTLEAQQQSGEIALAYLKQWGTHGAADAPPPPKAAGTDAVRPGAAADALRRASLDLLTEQARLKRDIETTKDDLARVNGDDSGTQSGKYGWRAVRIELWTPAAATLRLRYLVRDAHWTPSYRASVDVARTMLTLERQADIVQGSGEDWKDVHVRLSTGHARGNPEGSRPSPWFLDLQAPMPAGSMDRAAPAALQRVEITGSRIRKRNEAAPEWAADVQQGAYETQFVLPQALTLASDGEVHNVSIETQSLPVTLHARATPRNEAAVYLLAEAARPAGIWPSGTLLALRDGAMVGRSSWSPALGDKLQVPLGRDDQMQVAIESPAGFTSTTGLFGSNVERSSKAVYAITNRHATPVTIDVLDATPVSRNEKIVVRSSYDPQPATFEWDKQPGVAEWTMALAPSQTQRISIAHVVSYPKDGVVGNLP